jgi:hypothetical protein
MGEDRETMNEDNIVFRLRRRAEIRRAIPTRKSVQDKEPDRIADLLEEAALEIAFLRMEVGSVLGECVCRTTGQPHADGKTCETVHRTDGPCYRKDPECECPQDPPGSAHHLGCPQHAENIRFTVERPMGEMGVWGADGDWMPSPKCCDWCEEKDKSVRETAKRLGLELPKTDGQAYIDMMTGKRQSEEQ